MKKISIFPSLISGDLLHLADTTQKLEPHCDGFHLDVMDFHFVPNLTWGPAFVNAIRTATTKQLWIDLLVDQPMNYLDRLELHDNDIVSVHYESSYPQDIFSIIKKRGWIASIALDPKTPVKKVEPLLAEVDHVLLMSVMPGFSGQAFLPESVERIKQLNQIRQQKNISFTIGMDGGLNAQTLPLVAPHGLDNAGIASGIFNEKDPVHALQKLKVV